MIRRGIDPRAIGDNIEIARATARELVQLYRSMLAAGGFPPDELDDARQAAERWCRRAGLDFQREVTRRATAD